MQKISSLSCIIISVFFFTLQLLIPGIASAIWLDGPGQVQSDENGSFFACVTIHSNASEISILTVTMTGTENCTEVKINDHDCQLQIPAGEFHTEGFDMWLEDSGIQGAVVFSVEDCSGLILEFEVTVLPHNETPNDSMNWQRVKALYR